MNYINIENVELDDISYFLRKAEYGYTHRHPKVSEAVRSQSITNDLIRAKTLLDHYIVYNNTRAGL